MRHGTLATRHVTQSATRQESNVSQDGFCFRHESHHLLREAASTLTPDLHSPTSARSHKLVATSRGIQYSTLVRTARLHTSATTHGFEKPESHTTYCPRSHHFSGTPGSLIDISFQLYLNSPSLVRHLLVIDRFLVAGYIPWTTPDSPAIQASHFRETATQNKQVP